MELDVPVTSLIVRDTFVEVRCPKHIGAYAVRLFIFELILNSPDVTVHVNTILFKSRSHSNSILVEGHRFWEQLSTSVLYSTVFILTVSFSFRVCEGLIMPTLITLKVNLPDLKLIIFVFTED